MTTKCAWCSKIISGDDKEEGIISHGICPECAAIMLTQNPTSFENFLNTLDVPVIVVDGNGVLELLNKSAQSALGKSSEETVGFPGGDVFECVHASEPEGCGHTDKCSKCLVRNTVEETFSTGVSHLFTHVFLLKEEAGKQRREDFVISTEKVGDLVLLRIDPDSPPSSKNPA